MNVFIVKTNAITDVAGELLESGEIIKVFNEYDKAAEFIDNVKESYMFKKDDYEIVEMEVE